MVATSALHGTAAQNQPAMKGEAAQANAATSAHNLYRGSRIIGAGVTDAHDRKLGKIRDILLDSGRGEVAYVVVSFGGVIGLRNKYHAVPWKALQASDDGKHYVLQADRETVRGAPSFEPNKWPDMTDQAWSAEVDRYWNRMVGQAPPPGIAPSSGASSTGSHGEAGSRSAADGVQR
jgi:hypothetical protein